MKATNMIGFKKGDNAILHDRNCDFNVVITEVFEFFGEVFCEVIPVDFDGISRCVKTTFLTKVNDKNT